MTLIIEIALGIVLGYVLLQLIPVIILFIAEYPGKAALVAIGMLVLVAYILDSLGVKF
jgi:hypothetical protein